MAVITIERLTEADRPRWTELWRAYLAFYETTLPDDRYGRTWSALMDGTRLHVLGARRDGALQGIAHYLFHPSAWMDDVCYLQDLYVDVAARSGGIATALIEAVAEQAHAAGSPRLYWSTQENNATARRLYDRIARFNGFIRYDYKLG